MDFFKSANTGVLNLAPYQPGKPVEELERELGLKQIVKLASKDVIYLQAFMLNIQFLAMEYNIL